MEIRGLELKTAFVEAIDERGFPQDSRMRQVDNYLS